MEKVLLNSNWNMRKLGDENWLNAKVPGTVYCDLLDNGVMEDPFWKDNEEFAESKNAEQTTAPAEPTKASDGFMSIPEGDLDELPFA